MPAEAETFLYAGVDAKTLLERDMNGWDDGMKYEGVGSCPSDVCNAREVIWYFNIPLLGDDVML